MKTTKAVCEKLEKVIATWLSENFDHSWRLLINTLLELGWTKTAEKVEDAATKLRKKKENDTSYLDSTSHTIALLFSAQRARQVKRNDFRSRVLEHEKVKNEIERKLAAKIPNFLEDKSKSLENISKSVNIFEHVDFMEIQQLRKGYAESIVEMSKDGRESTELWQQDLQENEDNHRQVIEETKKLEDFIDKLQSELEELDVQLHHLESSKRTPQYKKTEK